MGDFNSNINYRCKINGLVHSTANSFKHDYNSIKGFYENFLFTLYHLNIFTAQSNSYHEKLFADLNIRTFNLAFYCVYILQSRKTIIKMGRQHTKYNKSTEFSTAASWNRTLGRLPTPRVQYSGLFHWHPLK